MESIIDIYGDAVVAIGGILAAFILLSICCNTYQSIIISMLESIFYK